MNADDRQPLSLMPGRRLIWAPAWSCSDAQVLFDGASGDYWLLSPLATALLHRLERGEPVDPWVEQDEDWQPTVERLLQVGLLQQG